MSHEPETFDLPELSARARVTPRTVRYYIQQGLLRSPGSPGPGAKYDTGHLDRLRLIRRMQREHLPLAEIRRRLEALSDEDVRELLAAPAPRSSAVDYVQGVLKGIRAPAPPRYQAAEPAPIPAERSQWDRIALAPDLELHVRRPLSRTQNRMVEKLLEYARKLLEEESP